MNAASGKLVTAFIGALAMLSVVGMVVSAPTLLDQIAERPVALVGMIGVSCVLQLMAVRFSSRGAVCASAVGLIAMGLILGIGAAMLAAVIAAAANTVRRRARLDRTIFNAAALSLSAGAAAAIAVAADTTEHSLAVQVLLALAGGLVYGVVNLGLLGAIMRLSEGGRILSVWRERLGWLAPYYLGFGLVALAAVDAHDRVGPIGLVAFAAVPAILVMRAAVGRSRTPQVASAS